MTNQNYTQLSNQEIVAIIDGLNKSPYQLTKYIKRHQPELYQEILDRTKFLNNGFYETNKVPLQARIHCIKNNIHEHPRCQNPNCPSHNFVEWRFGKANSFATYCSLKCAQSDKQMKDKKIRTSKAHFGVDHPTQSNQVKQKMKQTCIERYGTSNCMRLDWVKDKLKQTNLERHGVECVFQDNEVKQKIKQTCIERYGVENAAQSEQSKAKYKEHCQSRWGVDNAFQSKEIKQKISNTMIEKYGVSHLMQLESFKIRLFEQYRKEMRRKYGVDHFSQTVQFHQKIHKPYMNDKYPDMTFGSSWEFKVYDFLVEHNIDFEYQPRISFDYYVVEEHHTYHPDFKIGDKIYEVKGDHFFRINESTGKDEMFCPYRKDEWSDEQYEHICLVYEAKHQCMIQHNVTILRNNDMLDLETTFGFVVDQFIVPLDIFLIFLYTY